MYTYMYKLYIHWKSHGRYALHINHPTYAQGPPTYQTTTAGCTPLHLVVLQEHEACEMWILWIDGLPIGWSHRYVPEKEPVDKMPYPSHHHHHHHHHHPHHHHRHHHHLHLHLHHHLHHIMNIMNDYH